MELVESLKNIGLNEKEAKVYLALLQTGKAKAYVVSKYSGLKKPTTYVILDSLVEKGFAHKTPRQKTMYYVPISPEELFALSKNKLQQAESALPQLKALGKRGVNKKVSVSYFEGLSGIREMYTILEKEMAGKEYVGFFAHERKTSEEVLKLFNDINEEYRKKNIKRRAVTCEDVTLQKFFKDDFRKQYNFDVKTLPLSEYDSSISIEIYKDCTQIFSHRYLQAITIDNPDIAKTMKQIFEIVWNKSNPIDLVQASPK